MDGRSTPEAKRRLRELALGRRPWDRSTGPRTAAGKQRSRRNSFKHGMFSAEAITLRQTIRMIQRQEASSQPCVAVFTPGASRRGKS